MAKLTVIVNDEELHRVFNSIVELLEGHGIDGEVQADD